MNTSQTVCPTCKREKASWWRPTKHKKVKAVYSSAGKWGAKPWQRTNVHYPAFKAKVSQASLPYRASWSRSNKTYMYCPDPWHDEQIDKMYAAKEALENAPSAEEQRKQFLADQKKRKEESAIRKKEKARLHKERQRKK